MGKEHKLLFDFGLPWEYFSSALQIKKKKNQKNIKRNNKTKRTTIAKKRELNTILCSSISFPMALNWQHNSPLSSE